MHQDGEGPSPHRELEVENPAVPPQVGWFVLDMAGAHPNGRLALCPPAIVHGPSSSRREVRGDATRPSISVDQVHVDLNTTSERCRASCSGNRSKFLELDDPIQPCPNSRSTSSVCWANSGAAPRGAHGVPRKSIGVATMSIRASPSRGTVTKPPAACACGSVTTSCACRTGAHHTSSRSKTSAHSSSVRVENTASGRAQGSPVSNREATSSPARRPPTPFAQSPEGGLATTDRPGNREPEPQAVPGRVGADHGIGRGSMVVGTVGIPRRTAMLISQPSMYMPVRQRDRHQLAHAGAFPGEKRGRYTPPPPQRRPCGPMPPRWYGSGAASGARAAATPARDQNAPTSNVARSRSSPAGPYPVMCAYTKTIVAC